ncbi:hypothetical protein ACRBEV_10620 [Methylobacterium phyllosphaerae]
MTLAESRAIGFGIVGRVVITATDGQNDPRAASAAENIGPWRYPIPRPHPPEPTTHFRIASTAIAAVVDR